MKMMYRGKNAYFLSYISVYVHVHLFLKKSSQGVWVWVWVWSMRGVRVQGMCPHEIYLGTCTFIFKKIKPRGVGVEYEGCQGVRDVSTLILFRYMYMF